MTADILSKLKVRYEVPIGWPDAETPEVVEAPVRGAELFVDKQTFDKALKVIEAYANIVTRLTTCPHGINPHHCDIASCPGPIDAPAAKKEMAAVAKILEGWCPTCGVSADKFDKCKTCRPTEKECK